MTPDINQPDEAREQRRLDIVATNDASAPPGRHQPIERRKLLGEQIADPALGAAEHVGALKQVEAWFPRSQLAAGEFKTTSDSAMSIGGQLAEESKALFVQTDWGGLEPRPEVATILTQAGISWKKSRWPHRQLVPLLFPRGGRTPSPSDMSKIATFAACEIALGVGPTAALKEKMPADLRNVSRQEALLKLIREEMPHPPGKRAAPRTQTDRERAPIELPPYPAFDGMETLRQPASDDDVCVAVLVRTTGGYRLAAYLSGTADRATVEKLIKLLPAPPTAANAKS